MANPRDELQATTDDIRSDADELRSLEEVKAALDPADPRQDVLADRVVDLVRELGLKAEAQREIVAET